MDSEETLIPGLFNLGLNIEKNLSNQYLVTEINQLSHYLEIEPDCIKPAICNLKALISYHMHLGRTQARLLLEKLVKDNPKDLNALADLIHVYKKMGLEKDASKLKEQLELHQKDKLSQAKSILGQANALTFDIPDNHNKAAQTLLKDTWKLLYKRKKYLKEVETANNFVVEAYKLVNTIPEKAHEKKIDCKSLAIEKYEKGISMLKSLDCSKNEIMVWSFNLAVARFRLNTWHNRSNNESESRLQNYIQVLEGFLDIIEHFSRVEDLEEPLKRYIAISYISFAQFHNARKTSIDTRCLPTRIREKNLKEMFDKAIEICPNDTTVLHKCGRYKIAENQYLEAIKYFNKSIELIPNIYINWFKYSCRRDAYYYHSQDLIKINADEKEIEKYLELAYNDGKVTLNSRCTLYDMLKMAQICYHRSKPSKEYEMSFECKHKHFIYEAVETIHEALSKRDVSKDGNIHFHLGKYYPYINEYRKSIESLKTALDLDEWNFKSKNAFLCLCKRFVAFYKRTNDRNLLCELRFVLKEAQKYKYDWAEKALGDVEQYDLKILQELVNNMIKWDAKGCETFIRNVLENMKEKRKASTKFIKKAIKKFEIKLQETENLKDAINGPAEIQGSLSLDQFDYDFFVSHSEKDKDWVNYRLRPALEDYDDEIKFKGLIPSRDFILGERKIESTLKGIKKSRKILIVLSESYLKENWEKFVRDLMIHNYIERKSKDKTIIPILLESCDIPSELKIFPAIPFTEENNWEQLRMCLTVNTNVDNIKQADQLSEDN